MLLKSLIFENSHLFNKYNVDLLTLINLSNAVNAMN